LQIVSTRQATLENGLCLAVTLDGAGLTAYVMLGEPDLESIAGIVPRALVEEGAAIHAAAVDDLTQAQEQIDAVLDNADPGDVIVFFCADADCWGAALDLLGLPQE
jgi:hypothetical protein